MFKANNQPNTILSPTEQPPHGGLRFPKGMGPMSMTWCFSVVIPVFYPPLAPIFTARLVCAP